MSHTVHDRVRAVLRDHAELGIEIDTLSPESDLYEAGLTSRASVAVMLAIETEFGIEFPDSMLRRDVFESIAAIADAVVMLVGADAAQ